ncbi:MAG: hypothetical protein JO317_05100, partial [Verrucomicrobiae bacterium]|nr:hypothetical protein [Verrucomicrobiae bacterium]
MPPSSEAALSGAKSDRGLEPEIQALGRDIFRQAGDRNKPNDSFFHRHWWQEKLLRRCLAHPGFKTQLFRFIDVLPAIGDSEDLGRHLCAYLERSHEPIPLWIKRALSWAATAPLTAPLFA